MSQQINKIFAIRLVLFPIGFMLVLAGVTAAVQPWLLAVGAFFMLSPVFWQPRHHADALGDPDIEYLKFHYVEGTLSLEEFEKSVDRKLKGQTLKAEPNLTCITFI